MRWTRPDRYLISRARYALVLGLLVVMPLAMGSNREWLWLAQAGLTLLLLASLAAQFALTSLAPSRCLIGARWSLVPLGLFLAYGALQAMAFTQLSADPWASRLALLQSLMLASLYVLVLQDGSSRRRVRILLVTVVVLGLAEASFAAVMALSGAEWNLWGRRHGGVGFATGTFVNRNHFAGFLEMALAMGIGLLIAEMRGRRPSSDRREQLRRMLKLILGQRMWLRLALVIMVIALVLTRSRMGNTAFFGSLMGTGLIGLWLYRNPPRSLVVLLTSLVLIDVLIVGTWFGVEQVVDRIVQTTAVETTAGASVEGRVNVNRELLRAAADHWLLGTGGGTFYTVFPAYHSPELSNFFDHAHNDYLEFLIEYGVVGCAFLLAFAGACLGAGLSAMRRRRDTLARGVAFASVMGTIAIAIHSLVDFNLHIPANAAYFMIVLALGWMALTLPSPGSKRHDGLGLSEDREKT